MKRDTKIPTIHLESGSPLGEGLKKNEKFKEINLLIC